MEIMAPEISFMAFDGSHLRTLITHIELGMNGLDHHDGIVYHNGNGQQQGRKREQVDGETKHPQEKERTNERHRHGDERDER